MQTALKVPLADLRAQYLSIKDEIDQAIAHVNERGNYVMGEEVERFEESWAKYCGRKFCVGVSSGTRAINLAFRAIEEKAGNLSMSGVFLPAYTFFGSIQLDETQFFPTLLDVGKDTAVLNQKGLEKAIDAESAVGLTVDLYGYPALTSSSERIVEDAAQAHGISARGFITCYSFYPTKNLGAHGQAGAVVTNDPEVANIIRTLRNHGEGPRRFENVRFSGNHRIDELQAAILNAKLPSLNSWNARRKVIAAHYRRELAGLVTPQADHPEHVYHCFAIRSKSRDMLREHLLSTGIETSVRYPVPVHRQPAWNGFFGDAEHFPNAERWAREVLTLPIYPEMTDAQVEYVIKQVKACVLQSSATP